MQPINIKPTKKQPLGRWLGLIGLAAFVVVFMHFYPATAAALGDGDTGAATCAECHEDLTAAFKGSVHGVIDSKKMAGIAGAAFSCDSCHGDLKKHLGNPEAGNIFNFKGTANEASKMCLSCHIDNHGQYFASSHGKASMACTNCHAVHKKDNTHPTKSCYSCHTDVFAKFKMNENHKVMECSACHNPHEPATRTRLGGFKQEACYKCHTDKAGPYLYEHMSLTIDGCSACHDVHGSPNRHMLVDQSVSQLCYSCHTVVPGWHSRFTPDSNCTNCHNTIHGSNLSAKFLK